MPPVATGSALLLQFFFLFFFFFFLPSVPTPPELHRFPHLSGKKTSTLHPPWRFYPRLLDGRSDPFALLDEEDDLR